jgi:hypothetical protein
MDNGKRREFQTADEYLGQGYGWNDNTAIPASVFNAIAAGSPIAANSFHVNGAFVKYYNSDTVYLIENGKKRPFSDADLFWSYWPAAHDDWGATLIASVNSSNRWRLDQRPTGSPMSFREGVLLKSASSGTIYTIEAGKRRKVLSEQALNALGYQRSDALIVSSSLLSPIPSGSAIALKSLLVDGSIVRHSDGGIWRLEDGKKRSFPTWEVYLSWGYDSSSFAQFPDAEMSTIPTGAQITFRDGTLLRGTVGEPVYVVEHQKKRLFPSMDVLLEYGYETDDILLVPDSQLSLIAAGTPMDIGSPTPISLEINSGAQYAGDPDVTVSVHAQDFSSGVRWVHLSNDNWASEQVKDRTSGRRF